MKNILIVDDERYIRGVMRRTLEEEGYNVVEADNGKTALKRFNENITQNKTDIMIVDLVMPEMDGLELIRHVKKSSPDVKIIAISGGGGVDANDYLNAAKTFGAKAVIKKPFDIDDIVNCTNLLSSIVN